LKGLRKGKKCRTFERAQGEKKDMDEGVKEARLSISGAMTDHSHLGPKKRGMFKKTRGPRGEGA